MRRRIALLLLVTGLGVLPVALLARGRLAATGVARGKPAAQPAPEGLSPDQALAQDLALSDARVQAQTVGRRAEVLAVRPVRGQTTAASRACLAAACWLVEVYLFDENTTVVAIVEPGARLVHDVLIQPGVQPPANARLNALALDIILNHPDVIAALGYRPTAVDMAPVSGNMVGTACEGEHLCVAGTFNVADQVLWAVVDLTDEVFVGINWTPSDSTGESVRFTPDGCPAGGSVERDGWTMTYNTTNSDGLLVSDVAFQGVPIATSVKLLEWHVDYGTTGFNDSTGCAFTGGGFPIFAFGETEIITLTESGAVVGFELYQDFRMPDWGVECNYRYAQRYQFFDDGRFRVVGGAYGKGCSELAVYRPVMRVDFALGGDDGDSYLRYDGLNYVTQTIENYWTPYFSAGHGPHSLDADGYNARIVDTSGLAYAMEVSRGQFGDGGRGDEPFIYVTRHRPEQGDTDMSVIGTCCRNDHIQGPDAYLGGESIDAANIVLWYVPQMVTDVTVGNRYCWTVTGEPDPETYPCFAGPMFVPLHAWPSVDAAFSHNGPILLTDTAVFTNHSVASGALSYTWAFGDGAQSTAENPTHTYTTEGDFEVSLTAALPQVAETVTATLRVIATPQAAFSSPAGPILAGAAVSFTNETIGVAPMTYQWDFGDGSPIVTDVQPAHAFPGDGAYTVVLTAANAYGESSATSFVSVVSAPTANFSAPAGYLAGLPVAFTNASAGTLPLTFTWSFGDGSPVITATNPSHTFAATGVYLVEMTALNAYGADTHEQIINIVAISNVTYLPAVAR